MNITYLCSTTPTAVSLPSWNVASIPTANGLAGVYSFTINTPAVCTTPFQPTPCGALGVDLSSIAGVQMTITNNWQWWVSPCSSVIASAAGGCTAQACQGSTELGDYIPSVATWTLTDNGIMQQIQDGLGSGCNGQRQTTLRFICNSTATTPYILQVNEYAPTAQTRHSSIELHASISVLF